MSKAKSRSSGRSRSNVTAKDAAKEAAKQAAKQAAKEAAQKWEERRKNRYTAIQDKMNKIKEKYKSISTRTEATTISIAYENCIRLLEKQMHDNDRCPNVAKRIKYIKEDQKLINELESILAKIRRKKRAFDLYM